MATTHAPDSAPDAPPSTEEADGVAATADQQPRDPLRWVPLVVAMAGYVALVSLTIRNGFNPTDEGLIVGYADRLLHGDVPHRDFIFSRAVGSSIMHLVDVVLPTPLLMTGRVFDAAEIFVYTLCLGCLALDRRVRDAHPLLLAAVVVAAVVNMHALPLMAWYTVDGLFLICLGLYWLRYSPRFWARVIALLMLGYAPLTKQSFFLGPLLALWFVWRYRRDDVRGVLRILRTLALIALPGTLYLAYMVLRRGLQPMLDQFKGVAPVYGQKLVEDLRAPAISLRWPIVVALVLALTWGLIWFFGPARRASAPIVVRAVVALGTLVVLAALGGVVWVGQFDFEYPYGAHLMVLVLLSAGFVAVTSRRFPEGILLTALAGWMAALSIGYPKVNLVAGSLALAVGGPLWVAAWRVVGPITATAHLSARTRVVAWSAAALAVILLAGLPVINLRNQHLYRDLPADQLTADLGEIDHDLAGIRTNPMTAQYLRELRDCVLAAGTDRVALVTDNTALYPVFDLDSPLPIIAMYPQEFAGSDLRLVQAFDGLNNSTERTVVLWQTFPVETLATRTSIPDARLDTEVFHHSSTVLWNSFGLLRGKKSVCGPFVQYTFGPGT